MVEEGKARGWPHHPSRGHREIQNSLRPNHPEFTQSHLISEAKAGYGLVSTQMGDHLGIPGAVGFKQKKRKKEKKFRTSDKPHRKSSLRSL